jgi:DNA-binding MarR family transcriptional regulator
VAPEPTLVDGLVQLSFAVQEALGRVGARYEVSITQMRLFGVLRDRQPAMMEVAEYLHLDRSSVTGLVDRAERRGMVERVASDRDGRGVHVRLTAEGRRLVSRAQREVEAEVHALTAGLTNAEASRLRVTVAKVAGHG